jgi:hypothetical protein
MPDARKWISRVRRVEPPDFWNDAKARTRDDVPGAQVEDQASGRPRLAALVTGLLVGALGLIVVLIAFRSDPQGSPPVTPPASVGKSPSGSVSPSALPSTREPVILTASADEEPVSWQEIAFIPSGDAKEEVGHSACPDCVLPVPSALAVDPDGSFWIADGLKERIAHFARDGSFIEAFPAHIGTALDVTEHAADLAFVRERLYLLPEEGGSKVVPMEAGGPGEPIIVNDQGKELDVEAIIPGQDQLLVLISGADRLLGGFWAYATVDPTTGQVTPSGGVVDSVGSQVNIQPVFDGPPATFEIQWAQEGEGVAAVQEVRFQVVRNGEERRTSVGDMYLRTTTRWGVATIVSISQGGSTSIGMWFLEILPESPSIVFERIPEGGFIGQVRRYLTVGSDGTVYWMRLLEDGLHIYQR